MLCFYGHYYVVIYLKDLDEKPVLCLSIALMFLVDVCMPHVSLAASIQSQNNQMASFLIPSVQEETLIPARDTEDGEDVPIPFIEPHVYIAATPVAPSAPIIKDAKKNTRPTRVLPGEYANLTVTAYSSTPDQTDGDPCTTANGFNVCRHNTENVIAANFLPFGTRVRFPEAFGDRIFIVQDRMNARYTRRADIWMKSRTSARKFGVQRLTMEIVNEQVATTLH